MNKYDNVSPNMLGNTEFFMGRNATKYEISRIIGSNDIYIYKETAIIDRDGPYLEPIGKHGEGGGHLLGSYKIKKDKVIIPDAFVIINKNKNETNLRDKYLNFFRNQNEFNSYIYDFIGDI